MDIKDKDTIKKADVLSKIEMRRKEFRTAKRQERIEMCKKMSKQSNVIEKPSLINNTKINKIISNNEKEKEEKKEKIKKFITNLFNKSPEEIANSIVNIIDKIV
jgi:hypothetical protein